MLNALLFALWVVFAPVQSFTLPRGFVKSLTVASLRANTTKKEEFYCLLGTRDSRGNVRVEYVTKPKQEPWTTIQTDARGIEWWQYGVVHDLCSPVVVDDDTLAVVADYHTHPLYPWQMRVVPGRDLTPSPGDQRTWSRTPYTLHIIMAQSYAAIWERQEDGTFAPLAIERFKVSDD